MLANILANVHFSNPYAVLSFLAWVIGAFAVPLCLGRVLAGISPGRSADERQGNAFGAILFFLLGAAAFVVAFVMLFIGYAEIPALVGIGLWGFAVGVGSKS